MSERTGLLARWRSRPDAAPTSERRRAVRHTTVLQIAKLIDPRGEELCVIRDISSAGLQAQVYHEVATDDPVTIELRTGYRAGGRVVWSEDGAIGVEFEEDVSVLTMLTHCSIDERIGRIRPPRLSVSLPATIGFADDPIAATVCDISLGGMKMRVGRDVMPDTRIRITLHGLDPRVAHVRWVRDGHAGAQLEDPLTFDEFAEWRRGLTLPPRRRWHL